MSRRFISAGLITLTLTACRAPVELSPTPTAAPTLAVQRDSPLIGLLAETDWTSSAVYSPDGRHIAFNDLNAVEIYDSHSGAFVDSFDTVDTDISAMAWSADGMYIAAARIPAYGNDGSALITIWDVPSKKVLAEFFYDDSIVSQLSFSPDSHFIAASDWQRRFGVWETATGEYVFPPDSFTSDTSQDISGLEWFGHMNDLLMVTTNDLVNPITVYDIATGEIVRRANPLPSADTLSVACAALSPDQRFGIIRPQGLTMILWDVESGEPVTSFETLCTGVAWSPDGRFVAISSHTISIWDPHTGTLVKELSGAFIDNLHIYKSLQWSSDGQTLLSTTNTAVILWDVSDLDAGPD